MDKDFAVAYLGFNGLFKNDLLKMSRPIQYGFIAVICPMHSLMFYVWGILTDSFILILLNNPQSVEKLAQ